MLPFSLNLYFPSGEMNSLKRGYLIRKCNLSSLPKSCTLKLSPPPITWEIGLLLLTLFITIDLPFGDWTGITLSFDKTHIANPQILWGIETLKPTEGLE